MYVTKFVVFEKSEKIVVWNTYNLHEFKFSASDSKICVRYDNLKFKQLLSLFWNHFGTIWPCFSYWFLVSFWGYFHIKGYYQLTNTSSDLTPFFLGFKLKELAEIRQFEPKNSHSSDTKVAWNPYEVMQVRHSIPYKQSITHRISQAPRIMQVKHYTSCRWAINIIQI